MIENGHPHTKFHFLLLLLLGSQLCLWGSPFLARFCAYVTVFFIPTIEEVTCCLRGWCVLGVFLVLALYVSRPPRWPSGKASALRAEDPGIFSGSSHTSDLNIGTPVATLPSAWRYRVSAGTGQPGVSIL